MKANSLSVCIPLPENLRNKNKFSCNKNCPYCVSKMTGMSRVDENIFYSRLYKVRNIIKRSQVNSVIFTGKSEPLLNMEMIENLYRAFQEYPLEIQTNGLLLFEENIKKLADFRFDTIAISIDSPKQLSEMFKKIPLIHSFGMTVRFTINLTKDILTGPPEEDPYEQKALRILKLLEREGVDQVSFRAIVIPNNAIDTEESRETQEWIRNNISKSWTNEFMNAYMRILESKGTKVREILNGSWQHAVYMYRGMSCMAFPYCVQDTNSDDDIRSLIYYEDGHLATTWYGSNHGRIF